MGSRFEIRTKDGESHYISGIWNCAKFFIKNIGNMYYIRINFD